jgi:hypothetical protein
MIPIHFFVRVLLASFFIVAHSCLSYGFDFLPRVLVVIN